MNPQEITETTDERFADALVLCLTTGMSLRAWRDAGVLEREWTIYRRIASHYGRILVLSYGDKEEHDIARSLDADVICDEAGEGIEKFLATAPDRVRTRLARTTTASAVIKTNQHDGGAAALSITRAFRAAGIRAALIARAGYPWSRFQAWIHGPASAPATNAAAAEGDLCRGADLVVCTTDAARDDLAWRYALSPERTAVVPNYVVPEAFTRHRPKPNSDAPVIILSAGRLEPQKNFTALIRAAAEAAPGSSAPLLVRIIGDGPERPALAALARSLKVTLELPGRVPHEALLNEMASCTLYVQCSHFEGHPKTLLEAMATAAPVIATDTPGLGTTVQHGVTGLKVDPDGTLLGGAIRNLLNDPSWRARLGDSAKQTIRESCSLDRAAAQELNAHRAALRNSASPITARPALGAVRWDATLLHADRDTQVNAWRASLHGFSRRLSPRDRVAFLLSLDDPIYQMQGPAAIEADGGLHPKHRLMRYHDFFVERIERGERVIDLGSGVGALAASIVERSDATVVGIEIEPANLDQARSIARERDLGQRLSYFLGDITSHRVNAEFDAVILSNVLEHMKDRPALLRRWTEWYRPRRFLIRVPAFDRDWKVPFKQELGVEWRLDDTHELEYTHEALEHELRDAGLEIGECIIRWGEYWVEARPIRTPTTGRRAAEPATITHR